MELGKWGECDVRRMGTMAGVHMWSRVASESFPQVSHGATREMNRKAYDKATDHALMEMVKAGDDPAFQQIVRRYKDPLTNYIYRIVNDYDTALDISQEVFIRVYRNVGQYKPLAAFSTWIFRIATNLSINEIRRRRKNYTISIFTKLKDYENEQTELPIPDSEAKTPEEQIIKKQVRNRVREALNSLPVKYRIPLLLRELAGHSYEEISAIINIPQGTVKSRINRGRLILKKKMLIIQY